MIRLIQQVCLATMYSTLKQIRICFIVGVAYKTLFSSYCVIVDRPGEGRSRLRAVSLLLENP